jgi:hypothetical protein
VKRCQEESTLGEEFVSTCEKTVIFSAVIRQRGFLRFPYLPALSPTVEPIRAWCHMKISSDGVSDLSVWSLTPPIFPCLCLRRPSQKRTQPVEKVVDNLINERESLASTSLKKRNK